MRTLALLTALALASTGAYAQYTGPSATPNAQKNTATANAVTSVKQVLASGKDDQRVTVQGHIVRHVRGKHYVFSDGTGELNIELKDRVMPVGQTFNDKTKVMLSGKLDKDWNEPLELEVKQMRMM